MNFYWSNLSPPQNTHLSQSLDSHTLNFSFLELLTFAYSFCETDYFLAQKDSYLHHRKTLPVCKMPYVPVTDRSLNISAKFTI